MNLDSNNLESELNKPLEDIVKGLKKDKKKERRGHNAGRGRGGQQGGRGRGLMYARRSPGGFARGNVQRVRHQEQFVRGGEYVQISRPQYRYAAPRYVETRYRYAPEPAVQYVTRVPRYHRAQGRQEYRRMDSEPIEIRYEEIPRQDIRLEGTARAPRHFDRIDANRARRRQEFDRRRQEGSRAADKRVNKN